MKRKLMGLTSTIFVTGLLTACGGGGGSSNSNFTGTANAIYDGTWGGVCEYDSDFMEADIFLLTIDGTRATIDFDTYPTSDCSGTASDNGQIVYSLDFVGTQNPSTGICEIDDLVNTKIVSANANGVSLSESQINQIKDLAVDDGGFPDFSLSCISPDGNDLYFFDEASGDGKTEATRPIQIDDTESISRSNSF